MPEPALESQPEESAKLDEVQTDHREAHIGGKPAQIIFEAETRGQVLSGYEDLTVWQTMKAFPMPTFYCVIPSIAAAADGYQAGINGSIIAQKGFIKQFATTVTANGQPALAANVVTAISTIQAVGAFLGLMSIAFISSKIGRKGGFYTIWLIVTLSVTLECVARRWQVWFVAKLFAGLAIGAIQCLTPTYIAECSPVRIRGVLLFTYDIWFSVGGLIAAIALQVMNDHDPYNWRIPIYTQWGLIAAMAIVYLLIPESPFWCANVSREASGRKALEKLNAGVRDFDVNRQWEVLVATVQHEREVAIQEGGSKWYRIFKGTDGFRTLCCAWTIVAAQWLGLPLLNTYAAYFFSSLGLSDPFALTAITKGPQIGVGIVCAFLVDKIGRRYLTCGWLTVMWLCDLGMAILGVVPPSKGSTSALVFLATLFICAVTAATSIGYGLMGELPAQRHRAHTAGFGAACGGVFNIINIAIIPKMVSTTAWNWGEKSFFLYMGLGFFAAFGSWFVIPEPLGRTSAELDELFEAKVRPWRFAKTKTSTQLALEAQRRERSEIELGVLS